MSTSRNTQRALDSAATYNSKRNLLATLEAMSLNRLESFTHQAGHKADTLRQGTIEQAVAALLWRAAGYRIQSMAAERNGQSELAYTAYTESRRACTAYQILSR